MKKILLLISLFLLHLSSCSDYLDRAPLDSPSSESFLSKKIEMDLAVNNAYRMLYFLGNNMPMPMFMDATTDIARVRGTYGANVETVSLGNHSSNTSLFSTIWTHYYRYIARCNYIIQYVDRVIDATEEQKNLAQAQALFLRAMAYNELVIYFGDVPFITTYLSTVEEGMAGRTDKDIIIEAILEDLDEAINILPSNWDGDNKGRITKWATLALKARITLYHEKYSESAASAKQIIDNAATSGIALTDDMISLFNYDGIRNSEVLLDIPFHSLVQFNATPLMTFSRNAGGWAIIQPAVSLIDSYECIDGLPIDKSPLFDQAHPFKNRDPRLSAYIIHDGTWFKNIRYETHPDSVLASRVVGGIETRINNQDVTNAFASHTSYLFRKYADARDENVRESTINFILIRYAEVLLTYAEAKLEQGEIDSSLYESVNAVRRRAGLPEVSNLSTEELRKLIRNERKVELAGEGLRLADIRRWKIAEHVMPGYFPGRKRKAYWFSPGIPTIDDWGIARYNNLQTVFEPLQTRLFDSNRDYLFPIPQNEIDVNGDLTQNPGY